VTLAPFVLPGESVRVEILRQQPGLLRARLLEVVSPSPARVSPACPHFTRCGGCHYQHASPEFQLEHKLAVLGEVLRRLGKIEPPESVAVLSGPPWQYRNRAQFHIQGGRIGYYEADSHRLCPVEQCPISSPRINESLATLRRMMRQPRFPRFLRSLEIFTDETSVQLNVLETAGRRPARSFFDWCATEIQGTVEGPLDYAAAGEVFRVSGRSFFQVNRFLIESLVRKALEDAEGQSALELYSGVGLFALPLARRFHRVTAVEAAASAFSDLEFNVARAQLPIDCLRQKAEAFLEQLQTPPDFLLADPPRTGLGRGVVAQLLRLKPPRLTIISCDPSTLARDLALLLEGGYWLPGLTLVDLFPQTCHIETVARLRLS